MTAAVFHKLLAIFLTVGLGWLAGRLRWLGERTGPSDPARVLSNVAFYIFVPALLFRTMVRLDVAALPWRTLAAYFVPTLGYLLAVYAWQRRAAAAGPAAPPSAPATPTICASTSSRSSRSSFINGSAPAWASRSSRVSLSRLRAHAPTAGSNRPDRASARTSVRKDSVRVRCSTAATLNAVGLSAATDPVAGPAPGAVMRPIPTPTTRTAAAAAAHPRGRR